MSIREHVYRQTYIVDLSVSQKAVERRHGFRQCVRPYQNFQFNSFSHPASLRQSQRNNICLTQRNSLPWRRCIRFSGHLPGLVWSNSRLRRVHSTGATSAQLNCDVSVNLQRRNYAAGTRVSTSGYVSPIQMILISQGKPSITTTPLTDFIRKAPAHEDRSCSRHSRRRRGRHAWRSLHAAEGMAALKRRADRLSDHRMGRPSSADARHRVECLDMDQAVSAMS
jgi:hypothetical protein